jgi:hypothetical protein
MSLSLYLWRLCGRRMRLSQKRGGVIVKALLERRKGSIVMILIIVSVTTQSHPQEDSRSMARFETRPVDHWGRKMGCGTALRIDTAGEPR